jgi:hypothetical protein
MKCLDRHAEENWMKLKDNILIKENRLRSIQNVAIYEKWELLGKIIQYLLFKIINYIISYL